MRTHPQSFLRQPFSALFANPANVRVLRTLIRHGGELSAPMLADRSKLTKPSVLAALDYLAELGFVDSIGSVRQRLHRIDSRHPLVPALAALFAAEDHRFETIIEAIRAAAAQAGVVAAWLYGSVARGEDRPDSDLDIAIVTSASVKAKLRDALRGLEDEWRVSVSLVELVADDILRLARDNDPWWVGMIKDAVPLVGPDPASLAASLPPKQRGAA
ncbi:MAG: nucleotidyltransferase domain-containing protein [Aliidongia sp.]